MIVKVPSSRGCTVAKQLTQDRIKGVVGETAKLSPESKRQQVEELRSTSRFSIL